jgi:hypothetical protein
LDLWLAGNAPVLLVFSHPEREVFAFLADFENVPKWSYAIDETTKVRLDLSAWEPPIAKPDRYRAGGEETLEVIV